MNRELSGRD